MSYQGLNPSYKTVTCEGYADLATANASPNREGRLVYTQDTDILYVDDGAALVRYAKYSEISGGSPLTTKGDLFAHNGTADIRFPVGTDGQVLVADSAQASGLTWAAPGAAPVDSVNTQTGAVVLDADDISDAATTNKFATAAELTQIGTNTTDISGKQDDVITTQGDIIYGDAGGNAVRLGIGANGQVLEIVAGFPVWTAPTAAPVTSVNGDTGVVVLDADDIADTATNVFVSPAEKTAIGTNTTAIGTKQDDVITTRGDIVIGDATPEAARLAVGTAGQVLTSDGTDVSWEDAASGSTPTTTLGDVIVRGAAVDERLAVGTNGQVLKVSGGVPTWGTDSTSTVDIEMPSTTGPDLVTDGTFPDLTNWITHSGTPSAVANELVLDNLGANTAEGVKQLEVITTGANYRLSFDIRKDSGTAGNYDISIAMGNLAGGSLNIFWDYAATGSEGAIVADGSYTVDFVGNSAQPYVWLAQANDGTDQDIRVTNVVIKQVAEIYTESAGFDLIDQDGVVFPVQQITFDPNDFANGATIFAGNESLGTEEYANSTFPTDVASWISNGGTFTWDSANLATLADTAGQCVIYQSLTLVNGQEYEIKLDIANLIQGASFQNLTVYDQNGTSLAIDTFIVTTAGAGVYTYRFTSNTSTAKNWWVQFQGGTGGSVQFNEISIKPVNIKAVKELVEVAGNYETASGKFAYGSTADGAHVNTSGELIMDKAATTTAGGKAVVKVTVEP